ncbi:MAG: mycothiol synthase [Acidimicrobiales bacterium]|nr:mycothiol synthase [Acidimicrobiales bacterium]
MSIVIRIDPPLGGPLAAQADAIIQALVRAADDPAVAVSVWPSHLADLAALVRDGDTRTIRLIVEPADERHDAAASAGGFSRVRELYQLRRPLPLEQALIDATPAINTRSFVPGADETAWVEVNNRAFAWHEDQAGWTVADLVAREAEPWFDPNGVLLFEHDGRLVGFCWTKVHTDSDPPLGEIYVIAVDPDFHGLGIGRSLAVAGLDHLAKAGITTGMLYVEANNEPALRLYRSLGFRVHHHQRHYIFVSEAGDRSPVPNQPAGPGPYGLDR